MSFFSITHPDGRVERCATLLATRYADANLYTDIKELVEFEIIPALGEYKDDFDIQAIQRDTVAVILEFDDAGTQLMSGEYVLDVVDPDDFWDIVQSHDITAGKAVA